MDFDCDALVCSLSKNYLLESEPQVKFSKFEAEQLSRTFLNTLNSPFYCKNVLKFSKAS